MNAQMVAESDDLTPILRDAAAYIREHGWTRGVMEDGEGAVCLHGAIRACTPRKGDAELVRAVLRAKGYSEEWNDEDADEGDVLGVLGSVEVTDADLTEIFGPQGREIVALVRRAAELTPEEAAALDAAHRYAARGAVWGAARDATHYAVTGGSAREAAWEAAWEASWDVLRSATADAPWTVVWGAVRALSVRDLIGKHGFEQEHYDVLTRPWRAVIGPVHPDDAPLAEEAAA